jgi:hypothetical protein
MHECLLLAKPIFLQHARHEMDRRSERCSAEATKHFRKINPAAPGRSSQHRKGTDHLKVCSPRFRGTVTVVYQERSLALDGERNGLTFPGKQAGRSGGNERFEACDAQP